MSAFRTLSALTTGGLALGVLAATPAAAAPAQDLVPLVCGGTTYQVVVSGQGEFTPGRDSASGRVFVPVAFGPSTAVVRDETGEVQETVPQPAFRKGSSSLRGTVDCSYTVVFAGTGDDELPVGYTVTVTGTVTVKVVGRP